MLLVEIEAVFRNFKNDLGIRPVYHQVEPRVEAHIFVGFQACCLYVALKHWLKPLAQAVGFRINFPPGAGTICQGTNARFGHPDNGQQETGDEPVHAARRWAETIDGADEE